MRTRLRTARTRCRAGCAALLLGCSLSPLGCDRSPAAPARSEEAARPSVFEGIELRDQHGQSLSASSFEGRLLVLNFMFTSCPVVCPRQTRELMAIRREMPAELRDRVRFLSLSVDPENDDPAALLAFARAHGAEAPGVSFATAGVEQTPLLTARLGAFDPTQPKPGPADHTTSVYVFDAEGRVLQRYGGAPLDGKRLLRELEQLDRRRGRASSSMRLGSFQP